MKYLNKNLKLEKGFTLVELMVVVIIMGILGKIGISSFNRYIRRTRALAAKTALVSIQKECEMNRTLGMDEVFTPLPTNGYSLQSRSTNSCLGQLVNGLISAIPSNKEKYPSYFYDFVKGSITCSYPNKDNLFSDCEGSSKDSFLISKNLNHKGTLKEKCENIHMANPNSKIVMQYGEHGDAKEAEPWVHNKGWHAPCRSSITNHMDSNGIAKSDRGSIKLLPDGNIQHDGFYSYRYNNNGYITHCNTLKDRKLPRFYPPHNCSLTKDLYESQVKAIKGGGFVRVFAGGGNNYAAQRSDGSVVVFGYAANKTQHLGNSVEDQKALEKMLNSKAIDVQFNSAAVGVKLESGEIVTVGHRGYTKELIYRLSN